ncbi:MAG TPA: PQQ-dependent sugar dehydrogenase [Acetobacteraceae bacterium]|nr:PQQ-dependent sugar dehydrogenase [Acetobacteraceae bacterium]
MIPRRALPALLLPLLAACGAAAQNDAPVRSERASFRVTAFASGLERPWGAAFLPDGSLLVTERPGRMRLVSRDGRVSAPLGGVPAVEAAGQGGLHDVQVAPDFATTREVLFCSASLGEGGALTRLHRARLAPDGQGLQEARTLLDAAPGQAQGRQHFGCRIVFGRDGFVYLSTGERGERQRSQLLGDLAGKVLRLTRDGRPAPGNPFAGRAGARPEIFSYGHRNPQGLALNPSTGGLWLAEMGPRGGDEVNLVRPGANYGWPVVTHGREYFGPRISDRTEAPGIENALHVWTPSVSPSGIAFYQGDAFPGWRGSLFIAALNSPGLVRLSTEGDRVTGEERLLWGLARMRHVVVGPDGRVYILTDETNGRILRLDPA